MQPLAIPRELTRRGELVVIPRTEYEDLLRVKKQRTLKKSGGTSRDPELDRELEEAMQEYRRGECYGPFSTVEESMAFLKSRRSARKSR